VAVLVIAEHDNAPVKGATLNTVTAALACGSDFHVLVAGQNAGEGAKAAAQIGGVTKVLHADGEQLGHQLAENIAAQVLAVASNYSLILFPARPAARTPPRGWPPSWTWRRSAPSPRSVIPPGEADRFSAGSPALRGASDDLSASALRRAAERPPEPGAGTNLACRRSCGEAVRFGGRCDCSDKGVTCGVPAKRRIYKLLARQVLRRVLRRQMLRPTAPRDRRRMGREVPAQEIKLRWVPVIDAPTTSGRRPCHQSVCRSAGRLPGLAPGASDA
jgi:hypothetical protein